MSLDCCQTLDSSISIGEGKRSERRFTSNYAAGEMTLCYGSGGTVAVGGGGAVVPKSILMAFPFHFVKSVGFFMSFVQKKNRMLD